VSLFVDDEDVVDVVVVLLEVEVVEVVVEVVVVLVVVVDVVVVLVVEVVLVLVVVVEVVEVELGSMLITSSTGKQCFRSTPSRSLMSIMLLLVTFVEFSTSLSSYRET